MNSRPLLILAALVLAICGGAVWFLHSQPETTPPPTATVAATSAAKSPETPPALDSPPIAAPFQQPPEMTAALRQPLEPAKPLAEWEIKIDQMLRSNADETQTAQMLINLLPSLPADGQEEAAHHITNLILDKDYNRVAPLIKNPGLPEPTMEVFFSDLMNREDSVKLPVLLEIAKLSNHPNREEATADLQIFLDEDYGQDWGKWTTAMQAYLKRQAEENAAAEREDALPPQPNNVPKLQ